MTFYNPFFPPLPQYPIKQSTENKQPEEKNDICQKSQKNNCKKTLNLGLFRNYLQETDTLILLALLFFFYKEDDKNLPLMFCLFLLLMDN